jgi:hypothetical protein
MGKMSKTAPPTTDSNSIDRDKKTIENDHRIDLSKNKSNTMSSLTRATRGLVKEAINQLEDKGKGKEEKDKGNSNQVTKTTKITKTKKGSGHRAKGQSNISAYWAKQQKQEETIETIDDNKGKVDVEPPAATNDKPSNIENGVEVEPDPKEEEWLEVQTKKNSKNNELVATPPKKAIVALKEQTAWNCTITPAKRNEDMKVLTIIKGLIDAMKQVNKEVHIIKANGKEYPTKAITDSTDVPTDKEELEEYAEEPRLTSSHKLTFRLHIATNDKAETIIRNAAYVKWMKANKVSMVQSKLTTAKPAFVGFYDEPNPERKKIEFLEEKIKIILEENITEYQVVIKPIFVEGKGSSTMVFMVMADKNDLADLRRILNIETTMTGKFYPWDQYCDLPREKKLHIIQQQQRMNLTTRSVIVYGFTDYNPQMDYEEDSEEEPEESDGTDRKPPAEVINIESDESQWGPENEMETEKEEIEPTQLTYDDTEEYLEDDDLPPTPNVIEFITEYFTDHNGDSIFPLVWGPLNGKLQIHFQKINENQAEAILEILKPELAKHMTDDSIRVAFQHPDEVMADAYQVDPWTPYTLAYETPSVATTATTDKTKTDQASKKRYKSSTYSITEQNTNNSSTLTNANQNQGQSSIEISANIRQPSKENQPATPWNNTPQDNQPTASPVKNKTKTAQGSRQPDYETLLTDVHKMCAKLIDESQDKIMKHTDHQVQQLRIEAAGTTKRLDNNIKQMQKRNDVKLETTNKEYHKELLNMYQSQAKMMAVLTRIDRETTERKEQIRKEREEANGPTTPQNKKQQRLIPGGSPMEAESYRRLLDTPDGQESTVPAQCNWQDTQNTQASRTATSTVSKLSCDDKRSYAAETQ